jgi:hypothetical protein
MTKEKLNLPKTKPFENPNPNSEEDVDLPELEDSSLTKTARLILEKTKEKSD